MKDLNSERVSVSISWLLLHDLLRVGRQVVLLARSLRGRPVGYAAGHPDGRAAAASVVEVHCALGHALTAFVLLNGGPAHELLAGDRLV